MIKRVVFSILLLSVVASASDSWSPSTKVPQNTVIAGSDGAGSAPAKPRALVNNDLPTVSVTKGGTGITSGTSGGVPYFSGTGTIASSGALTQYGVVLGGGAGATPTTTAALTDDQVLVGRTSAAPVAASVGGRNLLINGCMRVAQRATSSTSINNDTYCVVDRWNVISDGNTVCDLYQDTTAADLAPGMKACAKLVAHTAVTNKKFGIVQFLENRDAALLIGGVASLQVKLKVSDARMGDVRVGVLSWSGTADTLTSDIFASPGGWTTPTATTSWTFENTPANLSVTTSWATYRVENIAIDTASASNVAVVIWNNDTSYNAGDAIYVGEVQLQSGIACTGFERRMFGQELSLCQRYCYVTPDGTIAYGEASSGFGYGISTTVSWLIMPFPVAMRAAPALTQSGTFCLDDGASASPSATIATVVVSTQRALLSATVASGLTLYRPYRLVANNNAAYKLIFDAEL